MGEILLFIIAFMGLLSGLLFLKKDELPMPFFSTILGCFLTELCMGAILSKVYAIFSIAVGLKSMGIAYMATGVAVWGYTIKMKQFQKLKISFWDIYSYIIIVIWFLLLFFSVFTPDISNKYINSDAATQFTFALNMMDSGKISGMHFGELFNGLALSMAAPFLARLSLYKVYILSDSFANLINVFMFYTLAATFCRHKIVKALLPFLSFGYFLGWPLFSYILGGFGYLAWGVTLFAYVIHLLIRFYNSNDKNFQLLMLIVAGINCIGLAFCYMLFIPLLGLIALLTFIFKMRKNHYNYSFKKIVFGGLGVLIVGCIVVLICYKGFFDGNIQNILDALRLDGWTHKDLYRDFVFLMPAVFYMGWRYIKSHKLNLIFTSTAVILVYICITFGLCLCNVMSSYYFYKAYYLLWLFSWLMLIDAMDYLMDIDKGIVAAYGISFSLPLFMTLSGADNILEEKGIVVNEKHSSFYPSFYPILDGYAYYLDEENNWLEDKEALLDISGYILKNLPDEKVPLIACDGRWRFWYYSYTRNDGVYVADSNQLLDALSGFAQEGCNYVVIHQNSDTFRKIEKELEKYERKFNNGYYGLYHISY